MRIHSAVPVLQVANVEASLNWYREKLGFKADTFPDAPPFSFAILRHGETELMLQRGTPDAPPNPRPFKWSVYLRLGGEQLRELFKRLSEHSVVTRRLEKAFYGLVEFEITDLDGHVLCLSEELKDIDDLPSSS